MFTSTKRHIIILRFVFIDLEMAVHGIQHAHEYVRLFFSAISKIGTSYDNTQILCRGHLSNVSALRQIITWYKYEMGYNLSRWQGSQTRYIVTLDTDPLWDSDLSELKDLPRLKERFSITVCWCYARVILKSLNNRIKTQSNYSNYDEYSLRLCR